MEMTIDTEKLFEQFKQQIVVTRGELGRTIEKVEELETRVAHLQEVAASLGRLLGQEYVAEDAIGLTDAIRQAFKTAPTVNMNAPLVRTRLQQMGFNLAEYGNVLASIHTVLARLLKNNELRPVGMIGNSQAFVWANKPSQNNLADLNSRVAPSAVIQKKD
ncbi:MAG TPA: hypothetical protein VOA88_16920 [Candidatus Dormibacteraeota bacterium]|nr:hypothetical protein [Candidatus Dormibacteraeota bacterium]